MPQTFGVKLRDWAFSFLPANFQWGSQEEQAVETTLPQHSHTQSQLGFLLSFEGYAEKKCSFLCVARWHTARFSMTALLMYN